MFKGVKMVQDHIGWVTSGIKLEWPMFKCSSASEFEPRLRRGKWHFEHNIINDGLDKYFVRRNIYSYS